jgi:hypothetical protein
MVAVECKTLNINSNHHWSLTATDPTISESVTGCYDHCALSTQTLWPQLCYVIHIYAFNKDCLHCQGPRGIET